MRILVTIMLAFPLLLSGQEMLPLSLTESIRLALENNPSAKISSERVKDAALSRREAWSGFLPQIDTRGSTILDEKIRVIEMPDFFNPGQTISVELDFTYDYQTDWSITQPIFTGGKLTKSLQLARANLESAQLDELLARNDLTLQVSQAYLGMLVAQEFLRVATEAHTITEDFYRITQQMYNEGLASKLDLLQSEVQMANLVPRVTQARNAVKLAEAGLKTVMGIQDTQSLLLTDELHYEAHEYSLDELLSEALANRHELRQMDLRGQMGRYARSIARGGYLPMIALSGSYSTFGNDLAEVGQWEDSYTVSMGLSFNLFSGGRRRTSVQKAQVAIRQAELGRIALEDAIELEVEGAYHTLIESESTLLSSEKTVAQAEEAARLAQLQYQAGTITHLQANQIQANLTNARANYAQALFSYTLANIRIKKAVGRNLMEELGVPQ
ncbi:MAG: TolC family protein [Fidelibacterota bacterium]|nr:MAG: TolC family protein [Candidatus Neomarinimicrobiota bacterium]